MRKTPLANMQGFRAKIISFRDLLATVWPIILISALGFYVAYQFVEPAPPQNMTIAIGGGNVVYRAYAERYAEQLRLNGINLSIKSSRDTAQIREQLRRREIDVAFLPGGIEDRPYFDGEGEVPSNLRSLGSVTYEPVWVFYRGETRIDRLYLLNNKRIAVGSAESVARELALKLLEANGITRENKNLFSLESEAMVSALQNGDIDAAFVIAPAESPVVQKLLYSNDVRLMNFGQAEAYLRQFSSLSKRVLPRAAIDLVRDIPPRDTILLSTTSNIVIQDKLHPALISLMLQAMTVVNGKAGFFNQAGEFPAYKDQGFVLSEEAQHYYKSGPPFLQRYLPFWVAVLVDRLLVLIVPIFILLLPLLRVAPSLYAWRVRSKIFRCYGDLKFLENELRHRYDHNQREDYLARLDRIEEDAFSRNIPLAYTDLLYTLREHINLVRNDLLNPAREHAFASPEGKSE